MRSLRSCKLLHWTLDLYSAANVLLESSQNFKNEKGNHQDENLHKLHISTHNHPRKANKNKLCFHKTQTSQFLKIKEIRSTKFEEYFI
jgi:hypothetical protein